LPKDSTFSLQVGRIRFRPFRLADTFRQGVTFGLKFLQLSNGRTAIVIKTDVIIRFHNAAATHRFIETARVFTNGFDVVHYESTPRGDTLIANAAKQSISSGRGKMDCRAGFAGSQ
jgi:hypothetical protein